MAFVIVTQTGRYLCLSGDIKTTAGVAGSSLALETDTGNEFIFNGTAWVPYSQPTSIVGSLANTAVDLRSSLEIIVSPPIAGAKTVVATTAEIFAGASAKVNRRTLNIKNEDPALRFRIGPSTVNQQTGFPIEPGAVAKIKFDPSVAVPIYAISEGASLQVTVWEE